jgi:hypothetical protein
MAWAFIAAAMTVTFVGTDANSARLPSLSRYTGRG